MAKIYPSEAKNHLILAHLLSVSPKLDFLHQSLTQYPNYQIFYQSPPLIINTLRQRKTAYFFSSSHHRRNIWAVLYFHTIGAPFDKMVNWNIKLSKFIAISQIPFVVLLLTESKYPTLLFLLYLRMTWITR